MIDRVVLFSVVPLVAMLAGLGYAAVVAYRLRDPRPALFVVLLGLMSAHQVNELSVYYTTGLTAAVEGVGEYPETLANLTASGGVVLILRLVTREQSLSERLQAKIERERELRRENERLETFSHIVSHDLRNPLQVARGQLELARKHGEDEHFAAADRSLTRIETILEETLELARQGQTVLDPEPLPVSTAVERAAETVDAPELSVQTDPFTVETDPSRFRQLLTNLLQNAVDHGLGDDEAEVTVRIGPTADGFYVADDGAGIPAADRETVFEPGHTDAEDGTGFGLAIVEEIASAHGWTVTVAESETGGTRFEFYGAEVDT